MHKPIANLLFTLIPGLAGCCSVYSVVAPLALENTHNPQSVTGLVGLVGDTLKPYGFKEEAPVKLGNKELTTFFLRTGQSRIDVDVDHKSLSITIADFSRRESPLAVQVRHAIEQRVAGEYHTEVRFSHVPCSWLGP